MKVGDKIMKNKEYILNDPELLKTKIFDNITEIDDKSEICKTMKALEGKSCDYNCSECLIKYLELEHIEPKESDLSLDKWEEYYNTLKYLFDEIVNNPKLYISSNYLYNVTNNFIKQGKTLTENQRKVCDEKISRILDIINDIDNKIKFIKNNYL